MAKKVAFKNIEEVGVFITNHEKLQPWVVRARKYSVQLRALVDGEGFTTLLINKIEKLESNKISNAREKYSKDIRSLSTRLTNARSNVFQATGGSVELTIESETLRKELNNIFTSFKGQKSVHNYLSENLFQLSDIDPSGLIFIEYTSDKQVLSDIYPTYKSIQDVRDSEREWFINQIGQAFTEDANKSFDHPFGNVPAVVLSEKIKTGCKSRLSWFDKVIPDMELYAQKSSVKTIYEIQKGLPDHWKMKAKHRDEVGVNRTGRDVDISKSLQGDSISNDVTDITIVPQPRDGDPAIKAYSGYVSPDIDFLDYSARSIKELEETISETLWGTTKEKDSKGQETATGRYIDQQPIHNALNGLANIAEYVQNALANFVVKAVDRTGSEDNRYIYIAGRRFLIESVDAVLERYQDSMKNGLPSVILDKNLEEWVLTKYKTDPQTQDQMMTKIKLEPYVHWDIVTVGGLFGAGDAYQKVLFNDWWKKEADKTKDYNTLQKEFNLKIKTDDSSSRFVPTIEA